MKKTNTNKGLKKLIPAAGMLMLSAAMLGTSTFAWFTMNKEVSVIGMEVKAHAEEGLLINEVKAASSLTWDEQATANTTPTAFELRPASTKDLETWWHANSKLSSDEAGIENLSGTVTVDNSGNKYTDISPTGGVVSAGVVIGAEDAGSGEVATGGSKAQTTVYYKDAAFGSGPNVLEQGEGFYVNYKYYLKASSTGPLKVSTGNLGVEVIAEQNNTNQSGTALDGAIRVGVKIGNDILIFAPVTGADTAYNVTNNAAGSASTAANTFLKTAKAGINTADVYIPSIASDADGLLVDVYVWFEGEDENCMSDNLTAILNTYDFTIKFRDDDL